APRQGRGAGEARRGAWTLLPVAREAVRGVARLVGEGHQVAGGGPRAVGRDDAVLLAMLHVQEKVVAVAREVAESQRAGGAPGVRIVLAGHRVLAADVDALEILAQDDVDDA